MAIIVASSHFHDPPCADNDPSACRIDLLQGDLAERWSVFGGLAAARVHFKRNPDSTVEVEVDADSKSPSKFHSGIRYTAGLFSPGWYQFTADFQTASDNQPAGAQLEVESDRWRFIANAAPHTRSRWKHANVFFRPSDADPTATFSCRFWGAKGARSIRTTFKKMQIRKIAGDPPDSKTQFDLQQQEQVRLGGMRATGQGSTRSLAIALLVLLALAAVCWRLSE